MTQTLTPPPEDKLHFPPLPPRTGPLWAGIIGAPLAWAVQMQLNYALVPWICGHRQYHFLLHVTTLVFLALAIACTLLCWAYRHPPGAVGNLGPHSPVRSGDEQEPPPGRTYFTAVLGAMLGGLLALLILAQGIAAFFIDPCIQ